MSERYCNKCGYFGPMSIHQRPNGTGECGYLSTAPRATEATSQGAESDATKVPSDEQIDREWHRVLMLPPSTDQGYGRARMFARAILAIRPPAPPAGISPAPLQPTTETVPVGELVALRRNDARYRWLRTMWCQTILEDLLDKMPGRHPQKELDAAIDAAGAALSQGDVSGEGEGAC